MYDANAGFQEARYARTAGGKENENRGRGEGGAGGRMVGREKNRGASVCNVLRRCTELFKEVAANHALPRPHNSEANLVCVFWHTRLMFATHSIVTPRTKHAPPATALYRAFAFALNSARRARALLIASLSIATVETGPRELWMI